MLITLADNYFVLHRLRLYYAIILRNITQNDVGVENRTNDYCNVRPVEGHIKGLVSWQFPSPYHPFFQKI